MRFSRQKASSGFALLIFMVALMGLGGIAVAGFSQKALKAVEEDRFEHNKAVLLEAKQALLMFAYNYPQTNAPVGPGRLPCVDNDNDVNGTIEFPPVCGVVGRLPWGDPRLNIPRLTDASGETLWYAVSAEFRNFAPAEVGANTNGNTAVNSESIGTITLFDQSGGIIYDGTVDGIAAIIIAPGAPINRDENNDGIYEYTQVRATGPQRVDPRNYLDTFNDFDNSVFVNASNANDDGFILGPIRETDPNSPANNSIVVNDQMVVITTEEVVAMAEKATLEAYRNAISEYRTNIGNIDTYPWLDSYATVDALVTYDAEVNTRIGMIPSTFANYFDETITNPSQPILSNLDMEVPAGQTVNGFAVPVVDPGFISTDASITFNIDGDLIVTPSANTNLTIVRYYWDEDIAPDGWEECLPATTGTVQDCNQANTNPGVPDSTVVPNELATRVVRVTYDINLNNAVPFTRLFTINAGNNPVYQAPTAADHAYVFFEYAEAVGDEIDVDFRYDEFYGSSFDNTLSGSFNYQLGVRYYPVLPTWALAAENDWHNSIQMAYSLGYQPGAILSCAAGTDCLTVDNAANVNNDKNSLLVIASDHGMIDAGAPGFQDDLDDIFDIPHTDLDDIFDVRVLAGNDTVFVMDGSL